MDVFRALSRLDACGNVKNGRENGWRETWTVLDEKLDTSDEYFEENLSTSLFQIIPKKIFPKYGCSKTRFIKFLKKSKII